MKGHGYEPHEAPTNTKRRSGSKKKAQKVMLMAEESFLASLKTQSKKKGGRQYAMACCGQG